MLEVSTQSTQYVKVPIQASKDGAAYDPSSQVVTMTFTTTKHLGPAPTWYAASWENMVGGHLARCLIGPTGGVVTLSAGTYWVHVKVTDNPEVPAVNAGPILLY